MFKTTSDNENWMGRTGSHSTRPLSNGRIADLPEWAKEPEEYFNSIKIRYDMLSKQHFEIQQRAMELRRRLKNKMPIEEFKRCDDELSRLAPLEKSLEREAADYRQLARATAVNAFGAVFLFCARQTLDGATFQKLERETMQILARSPTAGIGKTETERMPDRNKRTKAQNIKRRFKSFRENSNSDASKRLAWSDEMGGIVQGIKTR